MKKKYNKNEQQAIDVVLKAIEAKDQLPGYKKFAIISNGKVLGYKLEPVKVETKEEFIKRTAIYHLNSDWTKPSLIQILYRKLKWFFFKR